MGKSLSVKLLEEEVTSLNRFVRLQDKELHVLETELALHKKMAEAAQNLYDCRYDPPGRMQSPSAKHRHWDRLKDALDALPRSEPEES